VGKRGPDLAFVDVRPILARLGDLTDDIVLIGGQAVSFWADYYASKRGVEELRRGQPFTSKDIDFSGDKRAVRACAVRLDGDALFPDMDDPTPNVGVVKFVDGGGVERAIDFVSPYGLDEKEVHRISIPMELLDDRGRPTGASFRVMHPVDLMESRVHNVVGLHHDDADSLKQLRASIIAAHEFLADLLDRAAGDKDGGESKKLKRAVLKLNERIFDFCTGNLHGKQIQGKYGVEPFDAILADPRLPSRFIEERLPQMQKKVAEVRARFAASVPGERARRE
jgi:hypothetical protein